MYSTLGTITCIIVYRQSPLPSPPLPIFFLRNISYHEGTPPPYAYSVCTSTIVQCTSTRIHVRTCTVHVHIAADIITVMYTCSIVHVCCVYNPRADVATQCHYLKHGNTAVCRTYSSESGINRSAGLQREREEGREAENQCKSMYVAKLLMGAYNYVHV